METDISMCRTTASLSAILGNCSQIMKAWFLQLFPKDFFKYVYIDTSMSATIFAKERDNVFNRYGSPTLVIRPKFEFDDNTLFGRLPMWMNTNYFNFARLEGNYQPVFGDTKNGIFIYSIPDRIKITFDIEIGCSSRMQQINIAHYLKSNVLHKGYFKIEKVNMEAQVPKLFMACVHDLLHFNSEDEESHADFTDYIGSWSADKITEKINPATGDPTYYYMYNTNLICIFEDNPQVDDGEQKDQIRTNFRINDSVVVDFWVPSTFYFETRKVINPADYELGWNIEELGDRVNMVYTMQLLPDNYYTRIDGVNFQFYKKQGYITDETFFLENEEDPTSTYDIIPLRHFVKRDIIDVARYCNKYGVDLNNVFEFRLYEENKEVNPEFLEMDWNLVQMKHRKPKSNTSYHLFLYIGVKEYNRILDRVHDLRGERYVD